MNDSIVRSGRRESFTFALEAGQWDDRGKLVSATVLSCLKNRMFGGRKEIKLLFDPKSKRFYGPGGNPDRMYGWELVGKQIEFHMLALL